MKTEAQITEKIKLHEFHIDAILETNHSAWHDIDVFRIEQYLMARKALLWVLSPDETIEIDGYEKNARFECTCFDSTKIF